MTEIIENKAENAAVGIKRPVKACLFDLDGVLVDTAVYHYKSWRKLANELGFDFTEEENEQLKGVNRIRSLELILGWGGVQKSKDEIEQLAAVKNNWYVEMINEMSPAEILPGAKEFLQEVKKAGVKTALGSASKNSAIILQKTGLISFFDAIVDGNTVSASKPDPEVFLAGSTALQVDPEYCVVFEDAIAGVEAGKAARMRVVGIGSPEVLKNADLVVGGLFEMTIDKLQNI
ncbi:beta-phosphoglucomutase [Rubrolithibacter danxiaensis]|uniref:beta-phosphoglucomutase n=1 Tax=Rubrolithibacter danxiaensis TaxID=3390805 RepID=UPI003BF80321